MVRNRWRQPIGEGRGVWTGRRTDLRHHGGGGDGGGIRGAAGVRLRRGSGWVVRSPRLATVFVASKCGVDFGWRVATPALAASR